MKRKSWGVQERFSADVMDEAAAYKSKCNRLEEEMVRLQTRIKELEAELAAANHRAELAEQAAEQALRRNREGK